MRLRFAALLALTGPFALVAAPAVADAPQYTLTIVDHAFHPDALEVPAGARLRIRVVNRDATPEEFESVELNREQVVRPNRAIDVYVGPLRPGTYRFFGDFHRDSARGRLIVGRR